MSKVERNWLIGIVAVVGALWLVKYVSEAEMRRLDKEVDRLCAIDGRSVIHETVRLPAGKFDDFGQPLVPQRRIDEQGFGYYMQGEERMLSEPCPTPCARLFRFQLQAVRTADGKVLAEHVSYNRGGGYWLEGMPGVGRGKICPGPVPGDFEKQIFIKE
jgi:hypothetical protein